MIDEDLELDHREHKKRRSRERREEIKLFLTWAQEYWVALFCALFVLLLVLLCSWLGTSWTASGAFFESPFRRDYVWLVVVPAFTAAFIVTWSLYRTGYAGIASNLGRKKRRAAVALVVIKGKVLLNRQTDWPWKGCWLLPGGYIRDKDNIEGKKEEPPDETVARRVWVLIYSPDKNSDDYKHEDNRFKADKLIAKTHNSFAYVHTMFAHGHAPIPIFVYTLRVNDKTDFSQEDFPIEENNDMRWFSLDDIVTKQITVPPHIKELIVFALRPNHPETVLRSWDLTEKGEDHSF